MGPARMRESLTTTPGIRERPRPKSDMRPFVRRLDDPHKGRPLVLSLSYCSPCCGPAGTGQTVTRSLDAILDHTSFSYGGTSPRRMKALNHWIGS